MVYAGIGLIILYAILSMIFMAFHLSNVYIIVLTVVLGLPAVVLMAVGFYRAKKALSALDKEIQRKLNSLM